MGQNHFWNRAVLQDSNIHRRRSIFPTRLNTDDYDGFGNLIHQTGSTPNNNLYSGEQFDSSLGIHFIAELARDFSHRVGYVVRHRCRGSSRSFSALLFAFHAGGTSTIGGFGVLEAVIDFRVALDDVSGEEFTG